MIALVALGFLGVGIFAIGFLVVNASNFATSGVQVDTSQSLTEAKAGHMTQLKTFLTTSTPATVPRSGAFNLVEYPTNNGPMSAYVGVDPNDGKKHPAIVWLFGGFTNQIGAAAVEPGQPSNDQSASSYRTEGMVMMYPALRGANGNPGRVECMYGEVDDVLDAVSYLKALPYVDKNRIYIGGHSTGGSLALLCAASSHQFAGCIALGPIDRVENYGADRLPFDINDDMETKLRSPVFWQHNIQCPTWIVEGEAGNARSARVLKRTAESTGKTNIRVVLVAGHDHFSIAQFANNKLAKWVMGKMTAESLVDELK